ncbi:YgeY family selenium metabolism-linked hydrolase [bacterium]|nr:YgeY family selenium metabolism-linked hydrolase [bacterium]
MNISDEIIARAIKYRDYTAKNLSEIVNIPSLSGQEKNVIEKLAQILTDAGFDDIKIDGLGNLIGRIGDGPKKMAFDAHIDVVDTGDLSQWEFEPFCGTITSDKVLGRGSTDQKGGAASMITAGRILKEIGYDGEFSLYFTFTVMEEDCDGMCWNYLIETGELVPDFAVLTEPTNLSVYRGHRGRMEIEVFFNGVSAHGAMPERGDNAVYKAARATLKIEKLNEQLKFDEFLGKGTVVLSMIRSESPSLCAVPDKCMFHLDRRLTWGETKDSAIAEIRNAVGDDAEIIVPIYDKKSFKGISHPQEKYFPTWKIGENHPLVQSGKKSAKIVLGEEPVIDKWTFSTNGVSICGKHKIPAIGFGPGNEIYAHAPNETVPIEHLVKASAFYALLPYMM